MKITLQFLLPDKTKYEVEAWVDGRCHYAAIEPLSMGLNAAFADFDPDMLATVFQHFADEVRKTKEKTKEKP